MQHLRATVTALPRDQAEKVPYLLHNQMRRGWLDRAGSRRREILACLCRHKKNRSECYGKKLFSMSACAGRWSNSNLSEQLEPHLGFIEGLWKEENYLRPSNPKELNVKIHTIQTWHKPGHTWEEGIQLRNGFHDTGMWTSLWGIFLITDWCWRIQFTVVVPFLGWWSSVLY